ncbi:MAG: hypothetical protein II205_02485 [Bacteroidales bacterium]|nr:hypothetical protein [Bacteroidales bacterium]
MIKKIIKHSDNKEWLEKWQHNPMQPEDVLALLKAIYARTWKGPTRLNLVDLIVESESQSIRNKRRTISPVLQQMRIVLPIQKGTRPMYAWNTENGEPTLSMANELIYACGDYVAAACRKNREKRRRLAQVRRNSADDGTTVI